MKKYKTIFWGSPDFALSALEATYKNSELIAVVSQPDKARGRGHDVVPTAVKAAALQQSIPVFTPVSLRKPDDEGLRLREFLLQNPVDFFVVVAYGNLLPKDILELPRLACVNVHASLLPLWRGAAPIQRALEAGDAITGVALQKMVQALDAGDVLLEKKINIEAMDNALTLTTKLSQLGGELVDEFLQLNYEHLSAMVQDPLEVTLAPKIQKEEGLWTPLWTAKQFINKLRAFSVWPCVKMPFQDLKTKQIVEIKIIEASLPSGPLLVLQKDIEIHHGRVLLKASDSQLVEITKAQFPGKGPVAAAQLFERLLNEFLLVKKI